MISLLIYMFYRIRAALEFEIELKESIQGVFKEDNDNYPWVFRTFFQKKRQ